MQNSSLTARPLLKLPAQVRPVDRHTLSSSSQGGRDTVGIEPAIRCRDMHGLAQQMCYATRYGIQI